MSTYFYGVNFKKSTVNNRMVIVVIASAGKN